MKKRIGHSGTITVSSRTGSTTTAIFLPMVNSGGDIENLIITPPAETYTYDFKLMNANSKNIYFKKNIVGTFLEDRKISIVKGTYTLEIDNADVDGSYSFEFVFAADW